MIAACVPLNFFRALLSCDDLVQSSGAAAERFYFQAEVLKHRDEEVAERLVVIAAEGQVLAMLEAATGQQDGQVRIVVSIRVPHVAAEQDHRAVKQAISAFTNLGKL